MWHAMWNPISVSSPTDKYTTEVQSGWKHTQHGCAGLLTCEEIIETARTDTTCRGPYLSAICLPSSEAYVERRPNFQFAVC